MAAPHRGGGVAATLLTEAERQVAAAGHDTAWLTVSPGNARARRFHQRQGWTDGGGFDHRAEAGDTVRPVRRYVESPRGTRPGA